MNSQIIKYYAGELSKEERKALLQKAFSDQELKSEMMKYQHLQSLMNLHPQEKNELLGRKSLKCFMEARQAEKRKRLFFYFLRYAAIVFVCIVSTWWITFSFVGTDILQPVVAQELSVPAGQRAHILLPDGSKVWVNAGSTLSYPSVFGDERRVKLTGEAFFEVAKGNKPFIVSTGRVDVKALGTQFNVFNYPKEELAVALLEGSVRIYRPECERQGVILKPNQQLTEDNGRFLISSIDKNPIIWKEGLYAFDKQKLKDILKKLELYYDVRILVKNPSILEYEYTGKFRQRDGVMEVLRIIQKIHPFKIEQKEDTNEIILYR